jgi:chaperonin GroES
MPALVLLLSPPVLHPLLQCAEAEKKTAGGVLLASDSGDKPNFGTVVAVGEGKKAEDGAQVKPNVAVGATVMYSKYSGTEYEVRGRDRRCGGLGGVVAFISFDGVGWMWMCSAAGR